MIRHLDGGSPCTFSSIFDFNALLSIYGAQKHITRPTTDARTARVFDPKVKF
jgi:hypothetical protein